MTAKTPMKADEELAMVNVSDEAVGRVVHEATAALKVAFSEPDSMPHWDEAPQIMRDLSVGAVRFRRANPQAAPGAQHSEWVRERTEAGWTYGPVKDSLKKTHPLMVPFEQLPVQEKIKSAVLLSIIDAMLDKH
jgi:hypothetical protein